MPKRKGAGEYVMEWLKNSSRKPEQEPYIKPSSLAKGCLLYVAFELQGKPKPPFDARVDRILSVGTDSHRRLQRALSRACLAQEVFFEIPEYRIHGFCDGILHIPTDPTVEESAVGFWALEFKTTASGEFDKLKASKVPKDEHVRQAQIYLWGIEAYYHGTIPLKGVIIYYENRDTLEHLALTIYPDPEMIADLLARVKAMLEGLAAGQLPDDFLPQEHWAHSYCPYLDICEPGQQAMKWQAAQPKQLPEKVLADIIAKRIVAKQAQGDTTKGPGAKKKQGQRSLSDLANDLDWG
ncbi:MAG: PD-(D/E)XK nuclease family protein [Caldilineaceae bacterium]|nr:PD-(D/E)XK nuclease family protein [Caldilineaceae bacterium]